MPSTTTAQDGTITTTTSPNGYKPAATPDSLIDPTVTINYWNSTPATVSGMLGGFPQVSHLDLQSSSSFLARLRRTQSNEQSPIPPSKKRKTGTSTSALPPLPRVVDCGAGIGRITHGMLLKVAREVDVVEPVAKFTAELRRQYDATAAAAAPAKTTATHRGKLGTIFNAPLEKWYPEQERKYDLIWIQWCSNQLTDAALTALLRRCAGVLVEPPTFATTEPALTNGSAPRPRRKSGDDTKGEEDEEVLAGGLIIVKENMATDPTGRDTFDDEDSSVTRSQEKYRAIFKKAELSVVATELQLGFPGELYPVRIFALQPMMWFGRH